MANEVSKPVPEDTGGFTMVSADLRRESAEKTWQELWPLLADKQNLRRIAPEDFNLLIFPLFEAALTTGKVPRAFQVVAAVGEADIPDSSLVQWHKLNGKAAAMAGEWNRVGEHARRLLSMAANFPGDGTRLAAWVTAATLTDLLDDANQFALSEPLYRQSVTTALQLFGPGHRNVLDAQNDLANALQALGKHAEAEEIFRSVLESCEHVFGPDHAGTLRSRDNLALALHLQEKHPEAEEEFRKVLASRLRTLGPAHVDTLSSRTNLALELSAQGKYAEEEQEHRAVLATRERLLGPENPQALWTRSLLIYTQRVQNKHEQAEAGLEELLKIRERVLGPDHPDTVKTRVDLAATLRVQGKHQAAVKVHRELLAIRERALGPEHPDVYKSCFNLAFALLYAGELDEAVQYAERNEQGCRNHYGPDHLQTREAKKLHENIKTALSNCQRSEDSQKQPDEPVADLAAEQPPPPPGSIEPVPSTATDTRANPSSLDNPQPAQS
jgi:tetratricopeptide (TPR) repeat protein